MGEQDIIRWLDNLPQSTGIYSGTQKLATATWKELRGRIPDKFIETSVCYDGIVGIRMKTGKTIRFIMPYEITTDLKFGRLYIDRSVKSEQYFVFAKTIVRSPFVLEQFVFGDVEDLISGGVKARDYYGALKGGWEISTDGYYPYCEVCGYELPSMFEKWPKVCPNCLSEMENGEDEKITCF